MSSENVVIQFTLDRQHSLAFIEPIEPLSQQDFQQLTTAIDGLITEKGSLNGIIISTPKFPGWENFSGMLAHLKFVKDHHLKVKKIALVTDTLLADIAEKLVSHFIAAEIKHFPYDAVTEAKRWVLGI